MNSSNGRSKCSRNSGRASVRHLARRTTDRSGIGDKRSPSAWPRASPVRDRFAASGSPGAPGGQGQPSATARSGTPNSAHPPRPRPGQPPLPRLGDPDDHRPARAPAPACPDLSVNEAPPPGRRSGTQDRRRSDPGTRRPPAARADRRQPGSRRDAGPRQPARAVGRRSRMRIRPVGRHHDLDPDPGQCRPGDHAAGAEGLVVRMGRHHQQPAPPGRIGWFGGHRRAAPDCFGSSRPAMVEFGLECRHQDVSLSTTARPAAA